jgi:hypothetical protein
MQISGAVFAAEKQPVMGAGPSTEVVRLFFRNFSRMPAALGYEFDVEERSIKHAGGIDASGKFLFGRTGRPLNSDEMKLNKKEILLALVPIGFVVGDKAGVRNIGEKQLLDILTRKITNWKEVGGVDQKIMLAGREPTEAALTILKGEYPELAQLHFDQVLQRDHQVVNFIESPAGAYAVSFGFKANFEARNLLDIKGFKAGSNCGLVYDTKNANLPVVKAAIDFARSDEWRKIVKDGKYLPPTQEW